METGGGEYNCGSSLRTGAAEHRQFTPPVTSAHSQQMTLIHVQHQVAQQQDRKSIDLKAS